MSDSYGAERANDDEAALPAPEGRELAPAPRRVGSENDRRYRAELEPGICWRCIVFGLIPLIGLAVLGWRAYSSWSDAQDQAALQMGALEEQVLDLNDALTVLEADLDASQNDLATARALLLETSGDTPQSIGAKLAALPEAERAEILADYAETFGRRPVSLEDQIAALSAADRAAFFADLTARPDFATWFEGLSIDDRRALLEALPGARQALLQTDAALDGATVSQSALALSADAPSAPVADASAAELVRLIDALDAPERGRAFAGLGALESFDAWLEATPEAERAAFYAALPKIETAPLRPEGDAPRSLAEADARIAALSAEADERARTLEALRSEQAQTASQLEAAQAALQAEQTARADAETALAAIDADDGLADLVETLQSDLAAAQSALTEQTGARETAEGRLAETDAALSAAESDLALLGQQLQTLEGERNEARAALEAAQRALNDAEEALVALDRDLSAAAEAREAEMQAALDAAKTENEELADALAREVDRAEAAESARARAEAEVAALEDALAALRAPTETAAGDVAQAAPELAAVRAENREMRAALAQAEIDLSAADETSEEAAAAAAAAENRATEAERRAAAAENRARDAEARATEAQTRAATADARAAAAERAAEAQSDNFDALRGRVAVGLLDAETREADARINDTEPAAIERLSLSANVAFATGDAELSDDGRAALDRVASSLIDDLRQNPDAPWLLVIEGHTDRRAISTEAFPSNWELSTARASAVARYLAEQGVPAERLVASGRASYDPIDPARTAEAYRLNRRIEFAFRRP